VATKVEQEDTEACGMVLSEEVKSSSTILIDITDPWRDSAEYITLDGDPCNSD
jgi:hypothetical protein